MLLILNCDHIIQAIRLLMDSNSYTVNGSMSMQLDSSLLPERSHARVPFITVQASINASISLNGLNISAFKSSVAS